MCVATAKRRPARTQTGGTLPKLGDPTHPNWRCSGCTRWEATEKEPAPATPQRGHLQSWGRYPPANEVPPPQLLSWEGYSGE